MSSKVNSFYLPKRCTKSVCLTCANCPSYHSRVERLVTFIVICTSFFRIDRVKLDYCVNRTLTIYIPLQTLFRGA